MVTIYRNPYVIAYKEAFYEQSSQSLCIVMEHASSGDLQQRVEQLRSQ
jgi:NIMA (never in mitosis gene a)-related kinase 1/4/5